MAAGKNPQLTSPIVPSHLINTQHFLSRVHTTFPNGLHPDDILFTMDVSSLYSNIPVGEGILSVLEFMEDHLDDSDTAGLTTTDINKLLNSVFQNSYFRFGQDVFQQNMGVAMGNRLAPPFTIIFMHQYLRTFTSFLGPLY